MLDFQTIMKDRGYWDERRWHGTKHQYTFHTGTIIEFLSPDTYGKAHGPRRDVLFINECNNLPYNIVRQLMLRTRKIIWFDWNPSSDFWYYTELEGKRDDIDFLHLTYLDNEAIDEGTLSEIESMRGNKYLWQVYGLGELGEIEGKIYKDWQIIPEVPHEARLISKGLDYGYTNDPAALIDIYYYNGGYIFDELAYTKGLSNRQIADIILAGKTAPVIPDSAEPKSNDELRLYGITVINAHKGRGSVHQGIQFVQAQKCSMTARSVNTIKEYRNYVFKTNAAGEVTNEPEHQWSHAMDAIRYGMQIKSNLEPYTPYVQPPYEPPGYAASPHTIEVQEVFTGEFKPHRA